MKITTAPIVDGIIAEVISKGMWLAEETCDIVLRDSGVARPARNTEQPLKSALADWKLLNIIMLLSNVPFNDCREADERFISDGAEKWRNKRGRG